MRLISKSTKETHKLSSDIAKKILKLAQQRHAIVIALEGELGAGKTVFTQGLAKVLGIKSRITSPTFVILKRYHFAKKYLYHIDAYRLRDEKDLKALGIGEIVDDPNNIVVIEWSDRVKKILPKKHIKIHIDHINDRKRKITITQ